MTQAEARQRIVDDGQTGKYPEISPEQVEDLVARVGKAGESAESSSYTDERTVCRGIARAWRLKAGAASGDHTFMTGGDQFVRGPVAANCRTQAEYWERMARSQRKKAIVGQLRSPCTKKLTG